MRQRRQTVYHATTRPRHRILLDLDADTFRVLGGDADELGVLTFAAEAALLAARDVLRVSSAYAREQQRDLEREWLADCDEIAAEGAE